MHLLHPWSVDRAIDKDMHVDDLFGNGEVICSDKEMITEGTSR